MEAAVQGSFRNTGPAEVVVTWLGAAGKEAELVHARSCATVAFAATAA